MPAGRCFFGVALVACLGAPGCDEDPARSVKIVNRPAAAALSARAVVSPVGTTVTPTTAGAAVVPARPAAAPLPSWHPDACPPLPENSPGPSSLNVTGPCGFQQRGAAVCESLTDDFILAVTRKSANGATTVLFINVEQYHGPGSYEDGQIFVAVQDRKNMYRWSTDTARITVGADEAFAVVPTTRLAGEPMLADCNRLIGPETNYLWDCHGWSDEKTPLESTFEIVSGKLQCDSVSKRP